MQDNDWGAAFGLIEIAGQSYDAAVEAREIPEALAHLAVPALGDWCVVDLIEQGLFRRVCAYHPDAAQAPAMRAVQKWPPVAECPPVMRALETGTPQQIDHAHECAAYLGRVDEAILRGSCLIVPIVAGAHPLGLLLVVQSRGGDPCFRLRVAQQLAQRAGLALTVATATEERERALVQRDELMSVATHELRTPLSAILLRLQLLKRLSAAPAPVLPEMLAKCADPALEQVRRLAQMIDTLLDVDRLRHHHLELDLVRMDICESTHEIVQRLEVLAQARGTDLHVQACEPAFGHWDRVRLDQILTNLISNAIKYGRNAPVRVTVHGDADFVRVQVKDHGIGIAPEDHERVFQRFTRLGTVSRRDSLGLGLYIARKLARAHGGDITLQSELGHGSTFTLELPRAVNNVAAAPARS